MESLQKIFPSKKLRLYMSLHQRNSARDGGPQYDTRFLLAPKDIDASTFVILYRVADVTGEGRDWVYSAQPALPHELSGSLAKLVFLGKIRQQELEELLARVVVWREKSVSWTSHEWVAASIALLTNQGTITLASDPQQVVHGNYASVSWLPLPLLPNDVPTTDTTGQRLACPLPQSVEVFFSVNRDSALL
ncbi:hypothetical protein BKA70DRAFT_515264 [Coprinopsis sp. MPI-PUGE-AT-0042]|nr:hypothetical protein BKA70DRAFT_515264 [Coprinopsis sp. MPI-PUGE-AT-0042]